MNNLYLTHIFPCAEFNYDAEYHYLQELSEAPQDNQEKPSAPVESGACAVLPSEDGMFSH